MDGNLKLLIGSLLVTAAIVIGAVFILSGDATTESEAPTILDPSTYIRDDGYNVKGAASPSVLIVEFSDFECPACGVAEPVLNQIVADYPEDVTLLYRHFPLSQHPSARSAAAVAEAAGRQGKFWEMHDLLFANQTELTESNYEKWAGELGLDIDQFNTDRNSDEVKAIVQADVDAGIAINVSSTPTLIINGELLRGAPTYEGMAAYIEQIKAAQDAFMQSESSQSGEMESATESATSE